MSTIRVTGLNSGLDTESIISELASARSLKVISLQNAQTKLSWKIDAWKALNTKIYSLYSSTLSTMRLQSSYSQKTTTSSNTDAVSVVTGTAAVVGVQSLSVTQLAKAGYLTGSKIASYSTTSGGTTTTTTPTTSTTLSNLGVTSGTVTFKLKFGASSDTETTSNTSTLTFSSTSTIADVVSALKAKGVNANYDTTNQRLFVSSSGTGLADNFTLTAVDSGTDTTSSSALKALGLDASNGANKIEGQDASITLNGATFTSDDNSFEINGLTYTAKSVASNISITTAIDTSGIYNTIKNFVSTYDTLVNQMDTLYSADDTSSYTPLTSAEKSTMSDTEVTAWETKIKDSLLRRDSTLSSVETAMKSVMASGIKMSDGTTKYLSDYGISTLSYFTASDNEKNSYHIDGNTDDSSTKNNTDKLQTAITNDTDTTTQFFSSLVSSLYSTLSKKMTSTDLRSAYSVYNDKEMKTELTDYTTKISDAEDKLNAYVEKWYSKFSVMETTLSKLTSKASSISSLLSS